MLNHDKNVVNSNGQNQKGQYLNRLSEKFLKSLKFSKIRFFSKFVENSTFMDSLPSMMIKVILTPKYENIPSEQTIDAITIATPTKPTVIWQKVLLMGICRQIRTTQKLPLNRWKFEKRRRIAPRQMRRSRTWQRKKRAQLSHQYQTHAQFHLQQIAQSYTPLWT